MAAESAKDLLDKMLKRKAELDLESEALEAIISTYRRLLNLNVHVSRKDEHQFDLYLGASARAQHAARVAEMIDEARRIIIAERRPMKRGELVKRLLAQGFEIIGKDKNKVFGTNLWRSGKFIAVEGKGYWPNDVELPSESRTATNELFRDARNP